MRASNKPISFLAMVCIHINNESNIIIACLKKLTASMHSCLKDN